MASRVQDLENVKHVIRALLMVNNGPMPLDTFVRQYRYSEGHPVPYQKFGHSDCLSFLRSLGDTVTIQEDTKGTLLSPNITSDSADNVLHIAQLIRAQKQESKCPAAKTNRPPRNARAVTPQLPEHLHRQLWVLVSRFREGIDITFLEDAYYREFGTVMNAQLYGFKSLQDCLETLDFLEVVKQVNGKTKVCLRTSGTQSSRSPTRKRSAASSSSSRSSDANPVSSPQETTSGVKENIKKVLEKHPGGIFLTSFAQAYSEVSGQELQVTSMDLIQQWPELFHVQRPHSGSDFLVYSSDCIVDVTDGASFSGSASSSQSKDGTVTETYRQASLPQASTDGYFPVRVSHVYSPSRFMIQIVDPDGRDPVPTIMKEMEELYSGPEGSKYVVAFGSIIIGQAVAALYSPVDNNAIWYRACVTGICNLYTVEVELVDFGNRCIVRRSELRRLKDKFLELPAQAIVVSLAFVRPKRGDDWSEGAYKQLVQLSREKILMCQVADHAATPPTVHLCDTTKEDEEVFLSDALIEAGFAGSACPENGVEYSCTTQTNTPKQIAEVRPQFQSEAMPSSCASHADDAVRLVLLSSGVGFHIISYRGLNYIVSFELSQLLGWKQDCILQKLAEKEVVFPHIILNKEETNKELYDEVSSLNLIGTKDTAESAGQLCLFPISSIADMVNLFCYPHNEINREIKYVVLSYIQGTPIRTEVSPELYRMNRELGQMEQCKKEIYAAFSREMSNVKRVDQLHELETRISHLRKKIQDFATCSS